MLLTTQINSSNSSAINNVTRKFEHQQVAVTHARLEEFMIAPLQDQWERHEMIVELLGAIGRSSFHTVVNTDNVVTREMSVQILQAIRHNRPILMNNLPDFTEDVPTYTQKLITSKLHTFILCDLTHMDAEKIRSPLRHLPRTLTVDYQLDIRDEILIRSQIGAYLRDVIRKKQPASVTESPTQLQIA